VLAVELIKNCPVCSNHADQIEQRLINASTATHVHHRFNALEMVTHRLISDKAFEMLQKAENVAMQAEMANSHKDVIDPELEVSVLNSSLLDEINGTNDSDKADNPR
jgi:metal-sulfur cluster biosynthetic enzyme